MRLVSLDIDPHDRSHRIHLGPFVAGLNAVWGNRGSGKSTIAKFIRGLLYHRHRDASGYGQDAVDGLVGSMQWADTAGASRVISSADAVYERDYRFEGPYYHARQQSVLADAAYPNAVPSEQPWQRIGGEIFDAVFCGRLGEVLPERLWQAARELGIHVATGNENDETYRRLKAEEHRLQQRLYHLRVDDRDREWWSAERERLAARLAEVQSHPTLHSLPSIHPTIPSSAMPTTDQFREWESQRIQLHAERSELTTREADLLRRMAAEKSVAGESPTESERLVPPGHGRYPRTTSVYRDSFGTWTGYAKPTRESRELAWKSTSRDHGPSSQQLENDLASTRQRLTQINLRLQELDEKLRQRRSMPTGATSAWEAEELRARLAYAEEVLKSWDLYEQTRLRLNEVQVQLRGLGPYSDAFRGSFVQCVERYVRELSAGALRQLPTWALEALRRDLGFAAGLSTNRGRVESYREIYRDYRPDTNRIDYPVPPSQSSERQLVELAIRMAILDSAAHRIGRLPLILDDALDGFHGQTLDHVVRVLIEFARDGQQVLLMTSEQEVAERVRVHHGWVSHLNHGLAETQKVERVPRLYVEPNFDDYTSHTRPAAYDESSWRIAEANAQLADLASHPFNQGAATAFVSDPVVDHRRSSRPTGQYYLNERSPLEEAPGMQSEIGSMIRRLGFLSVGQWISADANHVANRLGNRTTPAWVARRQAEARLMCGVPQLRAFDARVLAGCGIEYPSALAEMHPGRLLRTVERFLTTPEGLEIMRTATSYELSRITSWIASARRHRAARKGTSDRRRRRSDRNPPRDRTIFAGSTTDSTTKRSSPATVSSVSRPMQTKTTTLRFYLDPSSGVVDAPSIGPRLAERLEACGIVLVQDLLDADPSQLAEQLQDKRIHRETVVAWQDQATLVCRIPNLRGHDAQMLVASGITTPEQLAQANANSLHAKVASFVSSKAGQRLLRGSNGADLNEIQQWIAWSRHSRVLRAA